MILGIVLRPHQFGKSLKLKLRSYLINLHFYEAFNKCQVYFPLKYFHSTLLIYISRNFLVNIILLKIALGLCLKLLK